MNPNGKILLDGSWEKKNRNITAAALTGLIGIGAIYFNLQTYLALIFISVFNTFEKADLSGGFFDMMKTLFSSFKVPILSALVISQYGFMFLPSLWITRKWHTKNVKEYLRLNNLPFNEVLLAAVITIFFLPAAYFLSEFIMDILSVPDSFRTAGEELFMANNPGEYIFIVLIIAVTPAVCEEVFFRGYVQRTLERTLGRKSFIITGIIFGFFHMQPLSLLVLSLLGILFSYFYYRSRSLFPSVAAHFTNNFIAVTLLSAGESGLMFEGAIKAVVIITSFTSGGLLLVLYMKLTKNRSVEEPEEFIFPQEPIPASEVMNPEQLQ